MNRTNQDVSGIYQGRVLMGKIVNSVESPFGETVYKVKLDFWVVIGTIVDSLYLTEKEIQNLV